MKNIITEIATNYINDILNFFSTNDIPNLAHIEQELLPKAKKFICTLTSFYYEEVNTNLVEDKSGRREEGYSIERHNDIRKVLTTMGEVEFKRTYFSYRDGGHVYLVDIAAGLESHVRLSEELSEALAGAACKMSFAKSSIYVADGAVSRQSVMNQVRQCQAASPARASEKRKVAVLHIDADEDHVTLRGGKNTIVPLISVYEGIERKGKRGICTKVFHISEYGKKTEDLWMQVLDEVMARYDLDGTKVYIHGDGAKWIQQGLEWFPGAIFVLDKYHKNKAVTAMTAGLEIETRKIFNKEIRFALYSNDSRYFTELTQSLISQKPDRKDIIIEATNYLLTNIKAIHICAIDPEANNGGCAEPHVSHILSSRFSTRPMAWSKKTLKQLAPMLANNGVVERRKKLNAIEGRLLRKATRAARRKFKGFHFAPAPNAIGTLQPLNSGKVTQLSRTLRSIAQKTVI